MGSILEDLRFALRVLAKKPAWTAAAVLALALGIGFNAAMYGTADCLVFRPLLIPEQERAVVLQATQKNRSGTLSSMSPAELTAFAEESRTLLHVAASTEWSAALTGQGDPARIEAFQVSGEFFSALGVAPLIGRALGPSDDRPGSRVAVLSYGLWRDKFGSDPGVAGKTIHLNGQPFTVAGVMPDGFRTPATAQLWTPLGLTASDAQDDDNHYLWVLARLAKGETLESASAELGALSARLAQKYPTTHSGRSVFADALIKQISGDLTYAYTMMILVAVGLLLLISCANVANLQFARASSRAREMAIRSALGAGRLRLIRQLLVENLLLSIAAAVLGVLLAIWLLDLIRGNMPPEVEQYLPGWQRMGVNVHVLLYTTVVTLLSALAAGLAPAWLQSRVDVQETLKSTTAGAGQSRGRHRLRSILVAGQVVVSLVLLVGAALVVKGFGRLLVVLPNVKPDRLLTLRMALPESRYAGPEAIESFHSRLLDRLRAIPGVEDAGMVLNMPYSEAAHGMGFTIAGRPLETGVPRPSAQYQVADDRYLAALGLPLLAGRSFMPSDGPGAPRVAIVSGAFARKYFSGEDPLGRELLLGTANERVRIVGVAGDVLHSFIDREPSPVIYCPARQAPQRDTDLVLRVAGDPMSVLATVRAELAALDPEQPIYHVKSFRKVISDSLTGLAHVAYMMGVLGLTALFLSMLGVYSLIAHSVEERTREIGVRVAFGAEHSDILWMVLKRAAALTFIGLALGLPLAYGMARLLSNLLFGVRPDDLPVFLAIIAMLLATALAACYAPARRALRTDPIRALRYE